MYIHELPDWPKFRHNATTLEELLGSVRYEQGMLLGRIRDWGFDPRLVAAADNMVREVVTNGKIEGEDFPAQEVRSSVARRLGLPDAGLPAASREVEGMVDMMLDATQHYDQPLTEERLFNWHGALFPTGRSGLAPIIVAGYRLHGEDDPMQVISGSLGRPKLHFEAPASHLVPQEMARFLDYVNEEQAVDPVLKVGIAHLWFLTIHPFDDGNGRIARALSDMLLARSDGTRQRFYSLSSAILKKRKSYYRTLDGTQRGGSDVTVWLKWFLETVRDAILQSSRALDRVFAETKFWQQHIATDLNSRQRQVLKRLWAGYQGKMTSYRYANLTDVSQDTATRDINDLLEKGILEKGTAGGRSTAYILRET